MRFIFFALGVPMMILSFFQMTEALPFVKSTSLLVNGHEIVLSEDEQSSLDMQVQKLFEGSKVMPALAVVFDNEFQEDVKNGTFVSLKFNGQAEINDLPFDELLFRVSPDVYGFNLFRSNQGIVQGRCIYIDLDGKTMQEFSDFVHSLDSVQNAINSKQEESLDGQDAEEKTESETENAQENADNFEIPIV